MSALIAPAEFFLLLATLLGVSALARGVCRHPRPLCVRGPLSVPGLFLYDSSLLTSADHVLAFWGAPVALALLRLRDNFRPRQGVLVGLMVAGAILTKYQGSYFFVTALVMLLLWTVTKRRFLPAATAGLACLLASSCHWLKNIFFYGDPLYPLLHQYFPRILSTPGRRPCSSASTFAPAHPLGNLGTPPGRDRPGAVYLRLRPP